MQERSALLHGELQLTGAYQMQKFMLRELLFSAGAVHASAFYNAAVARSEEAALSARQ